MISLHKYTFYFIFINSEQNEKTVNRCLSSDNKSLATITLIMRPKRIDESNENSSISGEEDVQVKQIVIYDVLLWRNSNRTTRP